MVNRTELTTLKFPIVLKMTYFWETFRISTQIIVQINDYNKNLRNDPYERDCSKNLSEIVHRK